MDMEWCEASDAADKDPVNIEDDTHGDKIPSRPTAATTVSMIHIRAGSNFTFVLLFISFCRCPKTRKSLGTFISIQMLSDVAVGVFTSTEG